MVHLEYVLAPMAVAINGSLIMWLQASFALTTFGILFILGCGDVNSSQDHRSALANSVGQSMSNVDSQVGTAITPLLAAVGARDEVRVKKLLDDGARPDDPTAGRSPLVQAITAFDPKLGATLTCHVEIVQALLDHGADPNRADPHIGALPLQTAFDVGDMECARIIHAAGGRADLREAGGRTILMAAVGAAARKHNAEVLDLAIGWVADISERAEDGSTALHEAVRINSSDVAKALLVRGVNPCIKNNIGQTPLEMAINLNRPIELVEVLRHAMSCNDSKKNK